MNKILNIPNLYILLGCLYTLQGILYSPGTIAQLILVVFLAISFYYVFHVNLNHNTPSFIKVLNVFLIVQTIYGITMLLSGQSYFIQESYTTVFNLDYLKNIYVSLLPIYVFYALTKEGAITENLIRSWFWIFLIIVTMQYWYGHYKMLDDALSMGSTADEFTNNIGYSFIALTPLLFFLNKNRIIQFIAFLYIMVYILMAMKRGAIIIAFVIFCWFIYRTYKEVSQRSKVWIILLAIVAIICTWQYILYMYNTSDYFQYRLESTLDGESSNRDIIFSNLYHHFVYETTSSEFLFGLGANGTLTVSNNFAHNDWLEIATNQGVLGLVIYVAYWISLINCWMKSKRQYKVYSAIGAFVFVYLISTLFSMSYNSIPLYATFCLGYCLNYKD